MPRPGVMAPAHLAVKEIGLQHRAGGADRFSLRRMVGGVLPTGDRARTGTPPLGRASGGRPTRAVFARQLAFDPGPHLVDGGALDLGDRVHGVVVADSDPDRREVADLAGTRPPLMELVHVPMRPAWPAALRSTTVRVC